MKGVLSEIASLWLAFWPYLVWFALARYVFGATAMESFLFAVVLWLAQFINQLNERIRALERRPPA